MSKKKNRREREVARRLRLKQEREAALKAGGILLLPEPPGTPEVIWRITTGRQVRVK
jgi:hypothetical protein